MGNDFFNGPFTDVGTWEIKVEKNRMCRFRRPGKRLPVCESLHGKL